MLSPSGLGVMCSALRRPKQPTFCNHERFTTSESLQSGLFYIFPEQTVSVLLHNISRDVSLWDARPLASAFRSNNVITPVFDWSVKVLVCGE